MYYIKIYAIKFKGDVVYVGQTKASIDARFFKHLNNATGGLGASRVPKLYKHIRENDKSHYTFELLEITDEANKNIREKYWITFYDTKTKCNTSAGGISAQGPDHYLYGKKGGCPAAIEASVKARLGKALSKKTRERMRRAHAERDRVDIKAVRCRETNMTWNSVSDCARHFNATRAAISYRIRAKEITKSKHKKLGTFTFDYVAG